MKTENIPLELIRLDQRNPRIAHSLEGLDNATVDDGFIELSLGRNSASDGEDSSTTYGSLRDSIKKNRGLISPIIVRAQEDGAYLTIEGNTRVTIFRELAKNDPEGPWKEIPAIVHSGVDDKHDHAIRLQAHLIGPRPWRAYAKGRYLHSLFYKHGMSMPDLLDFCGGNARKREIQQYIAAYTDFSQHFAEELESSPTGYSRFSAFIELQKGPEIKPALQRHGYTVADFAKWVADGNINPLQSVRALPRILASPAAKKAFLDHDAREAIKLLEQPPSSTLLRDAPVDQLATALANKLRTLSFQDARRLAGDPGHPAMMALVECHSEISALLELTSSNTDGAE